MNPFVLYHSVSARSFRPLWALEELDLPYKLVMLEFPPRVHRRDYLTLNQLGTIPAMPVNDCTMTESVAMCQYLATQKPATTLVVQPDEPDFPLYLNMLYYGEATLTFPQTLVLRYQHFEAPDRQQPQIVQDYTKWFLARTRLLNDRLQTEQYLCGDRFTIADISVGYALMLAELIGLLDQTTAPVQDYWRRLTERPAFQRALVAERGAAAEQGISTEPVTASRPHASA